MSILNVEHLTHGFGDRAIFNDVSFRLLKGEHIGLKSAKIAPCVSPTGSGPTALPVVCAVLRVL